VVVDQARNGNGTGDGKTEDETDNDDQEVRHDRQIWDILVSFAYRMPPSAGPLCELT
jgi:hypothetical protein